MGAIFDCFGRIADLSLSTLLAAIVQCTDLKRKFIHPKFKAKTLYPFTMNE